MERGLPMASIWHGVPAGIVRGCRSLLRLAPFILPVVFLLSLLQQSPLLPLLSRLLAPLTAPLGLPGEAALPLLTGLLVNKFSGIAGLLLLPLSPAQSYVAAVFLALAHNVVVESLIVWQSRLPVLRLVLLRTTIAYLAGAATHLVLAGTGWLPRAPLPPVMGLPQGAAAPAYWTAGLQALKSLGMLALFLLPLYVLLEVLERAQLTDRLERVTAPLARSLRLPPALSPVLLAGLLLGVATGAGVMAEALERLSIRRHDLFRLNLFLLLFHSVIEDTAMFALFPVPLLAIALVRFLVAWCACRFMPGALFRTFPVDIVRQV
jgi:hypothetical protein